MIDRAMRLVLAIALVCACSHNPPTRSSRPALVEEPSEPDAGVEVPLAKEPIEPEAADEFGRCTARPVEIVDPGWTPQALTDEEKKLLAVADDLVKRGDPKVRIPDELLEEPRDGGAFLDLGRAKVLRANLRFKEGKYIEAAISAHDAVASHLDDPAVLDVYEIEAATLYILGGRSVPPRIECFEVLRDDLSLLEVRYCKSPGDRYRQLACSAIARLQKDTRDRIQLF